MAQEILTQERLQELLHYSIISGKFYRRVMGTGIKSVGEVAGWLGPDGYYRASVEHKTYLLHRLAHLYVMGYMPEFMDHLNHHGDDNRWLNLRSATKMENALNQKLRIDNKSGQTGVSWTTRDERWAASIRVNKITIRLGTFINKSDAIKVRKAAEIEHGFHPNHGKIL